VREVASRTFGLKYAMGDKAYSSKENRLTCAGLGLEAVLPSRSNEKMQHDYDKERYKVRHAIENAFGSIKDCKRIALRCEKKAANFLAVSQLGACIHNHRVTTRLMRRQPIIQLGA
jgi:transposase